MPNHRSVGSFANVTIASADELIAGLETRHICPGNHDIEFVRICLSRKSKFCNKRNTVMAFLDTHSAFLYKGRYVRQTVRSTSCSLLVNDADGRCRSCTSFRSALRLMWWRQRKADQSSSEFVSNSLLRTPQMRQKFRRLANERKVSLQRIRRMAQKVALFADTNGVEVPPDQHDDFIGIFKSNGASVEESFPEGSFRRVFWDQQLKSAKLKGSRGMRWHPLLIRWALNLRMKSSGAYHAMRTAGFITLPSERTLRDYTHVFENKVGFQFDVNDLLAAEAQLSGLDDVRKHVVLVFDEMKIQEDLVYNKHSSRGLCTSFEH